MCRLESIMSAIMCHILIVASILAADSIMAQDPGLNLDSRNIRGAWFATGLYSINIANNGHTYSKAGAMGGYLGNWGGYAKIAFDLVGNPTPNVVGGFTKRLATFRAEKPSALYMYFGVGCGNLEHAGDNYYHGEIITLPDGTMQWVPSDQPSKTYWDAGTQVMFDTGVILRLSHMNFNLGYSITPDIGFIVGEGGTAPNHSIQIGVGYTF